MRIVKWIAAAGAFAAAVSFDVAPSIVSAQAPSTSAQPAASPQLDQYKRNVGMEVDAMGENIQKMNDTVFSFAELGFQEYETTKYLTGILEQNGFKIERGVAGIPTAWTAPWGSGKPVIALGSDIDCIPQASQKPGVAYHDPMIEGAPGHGEGHNSGQALNITAALAVKKIMEREKLPGTIRIWPGTAEELVGSKAYFIPPAFFNDGAVALFTHVSDGLAVSWGTAAGPASSRCS